MDDMRADLDRLIELLRVVRLHRIQGLVSGGQHLQSYEPRDCATNRAITLLGPVSWSRDSFGDSALAGV